MIDDSDDLFWLAVNAYHEARGQGFEGMVAVCHVVCNRAASRRGPIKFHVLAPWQFSWANNGARPPIKEYEAFEECLRAAMTCIEERHSGSNLSGADHYYASTGKNAIPAPSWAKNMKTVAKIGDHLFLRG